MTNSTKSKWFIVLIVLAILPMLMCGGLAAWWFGRNAMAAQELAARKSEIAARGLPIDDQSMMDFRAATMDTDESERWMEILETFDTDDFQATAKGIPIVGVADETLFTAANNWQGADRVSQFLNAHRKLRSELHDVLDGTTEIWTRVDFESFNTLLPYSQNSRAASRLLALEHLDAIRRDDHEQAFRSAKAMMAVARVQDKEPIIVCQLVSIAECSQALRHWKMMIELDTLTEPQLIELLEQLTQMDDFGVGFRLSIAGERAMALPMFDDPGQALDSGMPATLTARPIDALSALDFYAQAEAVNTSNLNTFLTELSTVESDLDRKMKNAGLLTQFDNILSSLLLPAFSAYGTAIVRSTMERRLTKLGIAVRLYEKRFRVWPQSLTDLEKIDIELGPIAPIGKQAFGYQTQSNNADDAKEPITKAILWGFAPRESGDQTPTQPVDLSQFDAENRSEYGFWNWQLSPSQDRADAQ
ncbi:MAG: hypothetical protein WBD31_30415 [Rubripirellula sp.]